MVNSPYTGRSGLRTCRYVTFQDRILLLLRLGPRSEGFYRFLAGTFNNSYPSNCFLLSGCCGPSFSGHSFSHRFSSSLTALLTALSFSLLARLDRLFYHPALARALHGQAFVSSRSCHPLRLCRLASSSSPFFRAPLPSLLPQASPSRVTSPLLFPPSGPLCAPLPVPPSWPRDIPLPEPLRVPPSWSLTLPPLGPLPVPPPWPLDRPPPGPLPVPPSGPLPGSSPRPLPEPPPWPLGVPPPRSRSLPSSDGLPGSALFPLRLRLPRCSEHTSLLRRAPPVSPSLASGIRVLARPRIGHGPRVYFHRPLEPHGTWK